MGYAVSRQLSWPDGQLYVEIETGGRDHMSPGMLTPKYHGEADVYDDPREAADHAVCIRKAWQEDEPDEEILIAIGTTLGGLVSHSPEDTDDELVLAWGQAEYEKMPKCDRCGEPLPEHPYRLLDDQGDRFCSEHCCDKVIEEEERENEPLVVEHPICWWYLGCDGEWHDHPDDAEMLRWEAEAYGYDQLYEIRTKVEVLEEVDFE